MEDLDRYYQILEVPQSASLREIKEAYRFLAKVWHPDRFNSDPVAASKAGTKLREINEAYEKLTRFLKQESSGASSRGSSSNPPCGAKSAPKAEEDQDSRRIFAGMFLAFFAASLVLIVAIFGYLRSQPKSRNDGRIPPQVLPAPKVQTQKENLSIENGNTPSFHQADTQLDTIDNPAIQSEQRGRIHPRFYDQIVRDNGFDPNVYEFNPVTERIVLRKKPRATP